MDQHPVPQNISSYEFRLVGDMTLKQFLQLAGGGAVGLIFYKLPLPFIVKWPLIFISVGIGIMLAFIPVQGRSFSQWLMAFVHAIYAPTEYYWKPNDSTQYSDKSAQENAIQDKVVKIESTFLDKINKFVLGIKIHKTSSITPPPPLNLRGGDRQAEGDTVPKPKTETVIFENEPPVSIPIPTATPYPTTHNPLPILSAAPVTQTIEPALTTDLVPTPENPNILTGLVHTHDDKILEGAIVEIINQETGMPVRALRSNKLGQFTIATPLSPAKYIISTELDKYIFEPVLLEVKNEILKPILIKANI